MKPKTGFKFVEIVKNLGEILENQNKIFHIPTESGYI